MDPDLLRLLQTQVREQCAFLRLAVADLDEARKAIWGVDDAKELPPSQISERLWYSVHSAMAAAGNVSKALWGSGGKGEKDREPLRASLGVADSSAFKNVALRNHLEHFDERLVRWFNETGGQG